jgi:2,3-bisphosphoglycerate-independent phosphoglycerate mutase
LVLIVLDGWGHSDRDDGNAIARSRPRFMTGLARTYPSGLLAAAGEAVGLLPGFIGNSEVGHLCLGAGRTVLQDLARIDRAIRTGELGANPVLVNAMDQAAREGAALHLLGLLSDGGVHSHIAHLEALVRLAGARGVTRLFVHPFLDGRDTAPQSATLYLNRLATFLHAARIGSIATVSGRYYAMDRDNRWERTEKAWRALVLRDAPRFPTAAAALESAYAAGLHDEFVVPAIIDGADGGRSGTRPGGRPDAGSGAPRDAAVRDGDTVVFFNFRADRARQLTRAFTEPGFDRMRLTARPALAAFVCFTAYDRAWTLPVAFAPQHLSGTFGEAVSRAGLRQLRIAETEKYAHVTYFFNGGEERIFPGEERHLVPSPRIATYDLRPEMSAPEVTAEVVRRLQERPEQVVILNYANADMVGHTGKLEPTVEACRVVDRSVEAVVRETLRLGGVAVVTADHGNAEQMIDPATGGPVTAHTMNPVPIHVAGAGLEGRRLRPRGLLADVAPTMLRLVDVPVPDEMEGRSLFEG